MDFTALVNRKIEERREGRSATVKAADAAEQRFRAQCAPLVAALTDLLAELGAHEMFRNAFGRPEIELRQLDLGDDGVVKFGGRVGDIGIVVHKGETHTMRITPRYDVASALEKRYETPVKVRPGDNTIAMLREHLADFLADIYLSAVSHYVTDADSGDLLKDWQTRL